MVTCANCGAEHPEGFEFCPSCGSSLKPAERTAEERKLVTVLFADVTGSTALGETGRSLTMRAASLMRLVS